ncbi:hypothetical protein GALMADRAFT_207602 [Galerina marginata CBS 339.88]|uniref:Uncharacterized protein n=1 Tax=Galerina marginata (strain CBS 339.88) TaxID=685588 RepID=A0A067TNN4_GALM3|nr:hypothetical protein GALMADRAFT_207602 [Galerina marginata CBS 339.88]
MDNHQLPNHTGDASPRHGHGHAPRMTGYRILVIVLTAGFGLSKAKLSYQGYSTAPNTLDWLYGVVAFLILYWLGIYERHAMHNMPLMFEVDYLALLWGFITGSNRRPTPRRGNSMRQD